MLYGWLIVSAGAGTSIAPPQPAQFSPDINASDLHRHIGYLASEPLEGRLTGTAGERLATEYTADMFRALGLLPAGDHGTYFQTFEFTAGVSTGPRNQLGTRHGHEPRAREFGLDREWRPLAFSKTGAFAPAPVVFAGYGIVAPAADGVEAYDAFAGIDVTHKWVLVLRYLPEAISPEQRRRLASFAHLRYKALAARDRGAHGLIVVSGPNSQVREQLVELSPDTTLSGTGLAAISVTDAVAAAWFEDAGYDLKTLQDGLDAGQPQRGFALGDFTLEATIDIAYEKRLGRNVLARLQAAERSPQGMVVLGAHIDHLGRGLGATSLAHGSGKGEIHYGADDNASGVGAMLEAAHALADLQARGRLPLRRDILFAAWSGEELGLLGSTHFTRQLAGAADDESSLAPLIAAYINMDMIGRLDKALTLHGVGSSSIWQDEIRRANAATGLPLMLQDDSYVPSDATAFYLRGVPVLSAFTGAHGDYHTPRDTADKVNYDGTARIARLLTALTEALATRPDTPQYQVTAQPDRAPRRADVRVYLGTIPDYSPTEVSGLRVAGVVSGGPAERAGLQGGDVIVELAGRAVENIYDYTYALNTARIGVPMAVVVRRGGEHVRLTVTPGSRE
jgi:hypothetical protein